MTPKNILAVIGIVCAIASLAIHGAILLPAAVILIGVAVIVP